MSAVETSPSASANLRDFLLLKDDDISSAIRRGHLSTNNSTTMEKHCGSSAPRPSRTLLDMFRGEEVHPSSSSSEINLYSGKDEKRRRSFEEMIRTQAFHMGNTSCESNAGAGRLNTQREFSSVEISQEILTGNGQVVLGGENDHGGEVRSHVVARRSSTPFGLLVPISIESNYRPDGVSRANLVGESQPTLSPGQSSREVLVSQMEETARQPVRCLLEALAEERDLSAREVLAREETGGGQSPRMLLMDLLEETDRQVCFELSEYALLEDDGKEESCGVGEANNCCVCMVRRKGAAFIPCGHTFCRLCSRELWVSRGTCPICNGSIHEVLDIF